MRKLKLAVMFVCLILVLSFITFSYVSYRDEPKLPANENFNLRDYPYPSPKISKSFELFGTTATFEFRLYFAYIAGLYLSYAGHSAQIGWVNFTETNQSSFLGLGHLLLLIDSVNVSETDGNLKLVSTFAYGNYNASNVSSPVTPYITISNPKNKSDFTSCFEGLVVGSYYLGPTETGNNNSTDNISEYNVTYSIEMTPVVEFGPYFKIGNHAWVNQSFQVTYEQMDNYLKHLGLMRTSKKLNSYPSVNLGNGPNWRLRTRDNEESPFS